MKKLIKILITGDTYLGGGRVKNLALSGSVQHLFGDFLKRIKDADLAITNLESPLVDDAKPILKTGPNLKSPINTVGILKDAGFGLLTLANNHIMDFGEQGLHTTQETCRRVDIQTVGAGIKDEINEPFIYEDREIRIGIINFSENEFGTTTNGSPGASALDPVQNYYQIKKISQSVDYLIVIVHGGHEGYPLPSPRMKDTYRFFIDAGAAAVVGHHPHCYSGYEIYKDAPIFYSIGNFLFDDEKSINTNWNQGYMVEFIINKGLNFEIIPYNQNAEKAGLQDLQKDEYLQFEKNIARLSGIITDDVQLEKKFWEFCKSSRHCYNAYIEPYSNRYLHALRKRFLFPSLLSERKKRLLLNLIRCESHRDILQKILSK